jgi:hypothetical protein
MAVVTSGDRGHRVRTWLVARRSAQRPGASADEPARSVRVSQAPAGGRIREHTRTDQPEPPPSLRDPRPLC